LAPDGVINSRVVRPEKCRVPASNKKPTKDDKLTRQDEKPSASQDAPDIP